MSRPRRAFQCSVIAMLLAVPVIAEQATTGADRAGILSAARTLINQDKPAAAIEKLVPLEAAGGIDVALLLGVAYYHANDHQRAIDRLAPIADALPSGSIEQREAIQVLGLSYFLAGRFADALPRLEATRAWAGDNAELAYVLGQAYVQVGQADRARQTFAATFGVPVGSAAAHLLCAQMMIRLESEALAETELKRALEIDPRLPQVRALLGQIALFRGRLDEAVSLMDGELAINPGNAMALYQLGDARVRQGKLEDGLAALQKSIWLNPFYSAPYIVLGKVYMQKDQLATAAGMLSRAIEYDPNNRSAHYVLGQVFQRMGRSDDAKREFGIAERLQGQAGR